MRTTACPAFVLCNQRSISGRHRRQPATLPGEKSENSSLNTINESNSFKLALSWLQCLIEIVGDSFCYGLVVWYSGYQTPVTHSLHAGLGCNARFCNLLATAKILRGLLNEVDVDGLGML